MTYLPSSLPSKRGTICVLRSINGSLVAIPLDNQASYQEWSGCFSLLG